MAKPEYKINYFEQIKNYYTFVFNSEKDIRPVHTSLYFFLLNQNNRLGWVEWFKCPFDLGMQGAQINSKNTYYKTLQDLQDLELIKYQRGLNLHKAPKIYIIPLKSTDAKIDTVTIPLSEPLTGTLTEPLSEPLSKLLSENIYKLIIDNYKVVNSNLEKWLLKKPITPRKVFSPPDEYEVIQYFKENGYTDTSAIKAFKYYDSANWNDSKGNPVKNWKQKMQGVWFKDENKIVNNQRRAQLPTN